MYYITEREVNDNFDMKTAIEAVRDGFMEYYKNDAGADSRLRTYSASSVLSTMPAFINKYNVSGLKTYISTKTGTRFVVLLFDIRSSDLIAIIEANKLGQVRTGAVTALATSILHRNCSKFTLIGSGFQAETQLEGLLAISDPEEVRIFSKTPSHAKDFAERMSRRFGRDLKYYDDLKQALNGADVISTITSSQEPVLKDVSFLHEYHLNLSGSNILTRREASREVIEDADLVVVEHLEQSLKESAEIADFISKGGKVVELKTVIGERARFSGNKKTIFKSMGIGLEDVASAYYLLRKMGLT